MYWTDHIYIGIKLTFGVILLFFIVWLFWSIKKKKESNSQVGVDKEENNESKEMS